MCIKHQYRKQASRACFRVFLFPPQKSGRYIDNMFYSRVTLSGGFMGCSASPNSTLQTCCEAVGSTPLFANGSYGCPFTYSGNSKVLWDECLSENRNSTGICYAPPSEEPSGSGPSAEPLRISKLLAVMVVATLLGTLTYV